MIVNDSYLDIGKIADSGQCFRMLAQSDGNILVLSEGRAALASPEADGRWDLHCSQGEFDSYWSAYFDLDARYEDWVASIDPADGYLLEAARLGHGLRVVRQSPWEALVSFIVSQRRSVASITTCVNRLCERFGDPIEESPLPAWDFPSPERLASLRCEDVGCCGVGYRAEYLVEAARRVASGELDFGELSRLGDEELLERLMRIKGVGVKVANCTALYGFHRLGLFPIDVWIARVLGAHYPQGFPYERYEGYAGFLQLLMFYAARH